MNYSINSIFKQAIVKNMITKDSPWIYDMQEFQLQAKILRMK